MQNMRKSADALKDQWDRPNKFDGHWRSKQMTGKQVMEQHLGVRGRGYKTQNATTDTNSVESVIESLEKNHGS